MNRAVTRFIKQPTSSEFRSTQVLINIAANFVHLGLKAVIGIWLTRYLIDNMGVAVYGLVPLATSMAAYLKPITSALNSALGRYLTIDIRREDYTAANSTFNTAFYTSLVVSIVLLPLIIGIAYYSPRIFNVPDGYEQSVQILFAFSMAAYLLTYVQSTFSVSTFARNRLDLQNTIAITQILVRIILIVAVFSIVGPALDVVGYATFLGTVVALLVAIVFWRLLTPYLTIDINGFDRHRLKAIFSTSLWVSINAVGSLMFLSVELVIVNLLLGAEAGGEYGSILQWSTLIRAMAAALAGVLAPIILAQFAKHEIERMQRLSQTSIKLLGLAVALMVGIIIGLSKPLLQIWLGNEFIVLVPLLAVMLGHLCINLAVLPLFSVQIAFDKVRIPALVTVGFGIANLILAIAIGKLLPHGIGVALAGAVILTMKNTLFTPIYAASIFRVRWWTFIPSILYAVVGMSFVIAFGYALSKLVTIDTWAVLIGSALAISLTYVPLVFFVILNSQERDFVRMFLNRSQLNAG